MKMVVFSMLAMSFIMNVIAVLFLICAVVLILIILIQKGKGGGLSGALAGGAVSGLLGSKSKEPLTWITIALVGVFLTLAIVMAKFYKPVISDFEAGQFQETPVRQEQPRGPEFPPPIEDIGTTPTDENADANSLGVR
ncbi:MAG: preprotein translocase subunit SecG [Planctomycetota bacterium]|nr:MAG: preprotein translocase subunit SecG [Planctomycetota bacterium]